MKKLSFFSHAHLKISGTDLINPVDWTEKTFRAYTLQVSSDWNFRRTRFHAGTSRHRARF